MQIIWRFRAKSGKAEDFRRVYCSSGAWAQLFARSAEYQGTILLQDVSDPLVFVVIDRWAAGDSFKNFRQKHGGDYELLDQKCLDLTEEEILVGNFAEMPA